MFGGSTYSVDMPTALAYQPASGGGQDGFVARLSASGTSLLLSTYMGGSGGAPGAPEEVNAVGLGASGFLLFAGATSSRNFPIVGTAVQSAYGGGLTDGFVGRINPANGIMNSSTYIGGSGDDSINGIASDVSTWIYVTGSTTSTDFPTLNPVQASYGGGIDAFVCKFNFNQMLFSTYLGGPGADSGNAIAIDAVTNIVVAGTSGGSGLPVVGSVGKPSGSSLTSFLTKLAVNFTLGLYNMPTWYLDPWHNTGYNGGISTLNVVSFGQTGDIPVIGDWDGTGKKRLGVFRNGTWILDINGNGIIDAADKTIAFGQAGDIPVLGDWNGTGRIKLGLFRSGAFILDLSGHLSGTPTGLSDQTYVFGLSTDIPVVADWNGSGSTKIGVFRSGQWLVNYNGDGIFNSADKTYSFGQAGDIPVVSDWNSSGLSNELGVFRNGQWILNITGQNLFGITASDLVLGFGSSGYSPIVY